MVRAVVAALLMALGAACAAPEDTGLPVYEGISEDRPTGSAGIDSDALIAAWDMSTVTDDGRLRDFGHYGLHGTFVVHAPEVVPGVAGEARRFDDVDDRIALPSDQAFAMDGPHTIAAWVRVDQGGIHQHIFACDDKYALWITPDDRYRLGIRGAGWSTTPGRVEVGQWTSVVSVLRGTKDDPLTPESVSLYVDGEVADAERHLRTDEARDLGTWNPGELFPADACSIGFESHQGLESHKVLPFVGAIDELMVFARAWTDDEVRAFARGKEHEE